ncbi:MAG: hypothetical protein IIB09_01475 [Bacteroidetes bacterium]|nr:hypothetical protein [Bacteroidota bacterium]
MILFSYNRPPQRQIREVFRDVAEEYLDWDFMAAELGEQLSLELGVIGVRGAEVAVVRKGRIVLKIDGDWLDTKEHLMEKLAAADMLAEKLAAADVLAEKLAAADVLAEKLDALVGQEA